MFWNLGAFITSNTHLTFIHSIVHPPPINLQIFMEQLHQDWQGKQSPCLNHNIVICGTSQHLHISDILLQWNFLSQGLGLFVSRCVSQYWEHSRLTTSFSKKSILTSPNLFTSWINMGHSIVTNPRNCTVSWTQLQNQDLQPLSSMFS